MGKGKAGIVKSLEEIIKTLPFKVLGIDSDNGSEFINHHLFDWCERKDIQFTRSRPYKKDDNAHIEQKNWTHVRKFLGWDRYDTQEALEAINDLYKNELALFMNYFQPSVKLIKTIRIGSRKKRIYDSPQTPLDRLLGSKNVDQDKLEQLKTLRESLDPFVLSEKINEKLEYIWSLAHYVPRPLDEKKQDKNQIDELSPVERETIKSISQIFGINVYVRTRKDGKLKKITYG